MIEIIPAIDLIGGRCVRLSQGDYGRKAEYGAAPEEMARAFADAGCRRIHLVDLDGAKAGEPRNLAVLQAVAAPGRLSVEWGGGLKSRAHLEAAFAAGARHAVVGSLAVKSPELMAAWLAEFGGERIVLGADLRDGRVSISGWLEDSQLGVDDLLARYLPAGLKEAIVTDIARDGMLQGPATELYVDLQRRYPAVTFTVSGGIASMADVERLEALGLRRVIIGKAIYEGRISLEEIYRHNSRN